jgi:pimeloyl-ACP methyl ester carboxylesterase
VLEATKAIRPDLGPGLPDRGQEEVVVAGHSLGGMVAQRLATGRPGTPLAGLVLVATGAARLGRTALGPLAPWAAANPRIERLLAGAAGPALMRPCVGRRPCLAHLVATRDAFVATPATIRQAVLRSIRALDLRAQLPALSVPTTVVVGGRDRLTPPRLGRTVAKAVPGARLVEVADAGHMLPLEAPDLLADLIAAAEPFRGQPGPRPAPAAPVEEI